MFLSHVSGIAMLVISAVIMVLLGLVFFLLNLWIIDFAALLLKLKPTPATETYTAFVILSAAILSAASMVGSKR